MSLDPWLDRVLTLQEWEEMPADRTHRLELMEGVLQVTARPLPMHQLALLQLGGELNRQLPTALTALPEVEVVVEDGFPPTVRVPDLIVVPTEIAEQNPPRVAARHVLLAVEILSPGSRRTDRLTKPDEYAGAGIPHFWLLDIDRPVVLTAYMLIHGFYELNLDAAGVVTLPSPAPLRIDLDALISRR